jgi:hypothetical protein
MNDNHSPEIMVKGSRAIPARCWRATACCARCTTARRRTTIWRLGSDRLVMLIANQPNIREVTAFPLNQQAQELLRAVGGRRAAALARRARATARGARAGGTRRDRVR